MNDKTLVVICKNYELELKAVLSQKGFEDFITIHAPDSQKDPTRCIHPKNFINNLLNKYQAKYLIGGSCLSINKKAFQESGGTNIQKVSQCLYYLASEAIVDGLQNQGAYVVSSGWLLSWQEKINFWGFDQQTAREFFHETTKKIILLDSGVCENIEKDLKDFAEYLDLPYETLYVGLDHLKLFLTNVMYKNRVKNKEYMAKQISVTANYAMALDMIRQLSESKSESDTIQQTIDIFTMLFSPEKIIFHSLTENIPSHSESFQFEGITSLTSNGQGFIVKISFENKTYGVLEIINIAYPQYLDAYINLTMNLIGVVSLALKEASYKEKLIKTTEKLEWELGVNEALSNISSILIYKDNDLEDLTALILVNAQKLTHSQHGFVTVEDGKTGKKGTYHGLERLSVNDKSGFYNNDPQLYQGEKELTKENVIIEKVLWVPVFVNRKMVGQIALANPERDYSDRDFRAVKRLANLFSLAIEQLRTEEINARMNAIVESTNAAIIGKTLDGIIISWNPGAEKLYGYSEKEVIGQHISIIVPNNKSHEMAGILNQIKEDKLVERLETKRVKKDGVKIEVSLNISPIKNKKGKISGASAIAIDITNRKKAERKLKEAELTRDMTLEAAQVGVFDWDLKKNFLKWDETLYKLYGVSKEAFSAAYDAWASGIHPEDKKNAEKDVQLAISGEKEFNSEFRVIWKDSSIHYINGRATIIKDKSGNPARMLGVNWDITEIKELEKELRQYSLMMKSVKDSIIVVDLEGKITHWNKGSEIMYGYLESEALGQPSSIIHKPEETEELRARIRKIIQKEGIWSGEVYFVKKDSTTGYCSSTIVPMFDDKGNKIGFLGINRDITARKLADEKLLLHSQIMNNMEEGVYLIGADDGIIKYTNPKFEKMFGYQGDEMVGSHASIVNAPTQKDPMETAKEIMGILNRTGVWHGEIENKKKDGTPFWCDANVSVFNHHQYGKVLVSVHSDITERKENEAKLNALTTDLKSQKKQLELLAATDSLTGLLNRRSIIEQIKKEISRQQRSGKSFSIVISDIDKFKNFNDSYGHPFGDSVLVKVTKILSDHIRDQDFIGRWGGEEFILLLPETDSKGAFLLSEKLRKKIEFLISQRKTKFQRWTFIFALFFNFHPSRWCSQQDRLLLHPSGWCSQQDRLLLHPSGWCSQQDRLLFHPV